MQQKPPKQPAPQRSRVQVVLRAVRMVHTSGGRELRRVRVASRRVGLVDVLWHDFHQSPSRRPEQREQLQWPSRLHLCSGECDNCGGNGPLAAGRYQSRLELQLRRPPGQYGASYHVPLRD